MIKKYCGTCYTDTLHNPLKKPNEYRCTQCGSPKRGGQKNVLKVGGKIMWTPMGG